MKKTIILLISINVLSCFQPAKLTITDLQLEEINAETGALKTIDTLYLLSKNQSLNLGESDTFGYRLYNERGQLIKERKRVFFGHQLKLTYDSLGLVSHKSFSTDFTAKFEATYHFDQENNILYQYWKGNDTSTCIFKFDQNGKLVFAATYENNDKGRGANWHTHFTYNNKNQLIHKKAALVYDKAAIVEFETQFSTNICTQIATDYYYSKNKLDSTRIVHVFETNPIKNQKDVSYFNSNGIISKTITNDTLLTTYAPIKKNKIP